LWVGLVATAAVQLSLGNPCNADVHIVTAAGGSVPFASVNQVGDLECWQAMF
jgi:hypothetical protein